MASQHREGAATALNTPDLEAAVAARVSAETQYKFPLVIMPLGVVHSCLCLAGLAWLAVHGPALVPNQDTRITNIVISIGHRISALFIAAAMIRSAWTFALPQVVAGEQLSTRTLVGLCRSFQSIGQLQDLTSLPLAFRLHVVLSLLAATAMLVTSSSFKYESLPARGTAPAAVVDVVQVCPPPSSDSYFCNGTLNANATNESWSYITEVYSGGQGTVQLYGSIGDQVLGANVTLAQLPAGWTLGEGHSLPWMTMNVSCEALPLSLAFTGSTYTAATTVYVNNTELDVLDIANMPGWNSVVRLYQQFNASGPFSSLSPWKVVLLARDIGDGTSHVGGVSAASVAYLGSTYLDLHGYGPVLQNVLGAAALCTFDASTGGTWPDSDLLWPPLNNTPNSVFGDVVDDCPTLATALLNYGPGWQYSPVSDNSLPGGSVSYIANNTDADAPFPDFFAAYVRNQWALMAYALTPQAGFQLNASFAGTGPPQLFITVTAVGLIPATCLVIGVVAGVSAFVGVLRHRRLVNRVEFESWWLVKAALPAFYEPGYADATEEDFEHATSSVYVRYNGTQLERLDSPRELPVWRRAG